MPSCALCSFGATSDKFLKEHMMMKHDEREFSCEICDSTIRGKQKMRMHKKFHVEVVGKSPQNGTERVSVTSAKTFFFPLKIGQK